MQMHCGKLAEGIGVPLDYDEQWAGTADSKNGLSFSNRIESERPIRIESNLDALRSPYSYLTLSVTLVLSCHVSEILEHLYAESHFFQHLPKFPGVLLGVDP